MYDQFHWTNVSARRNRLTMEYEPVQPFFLIALAEEGKSKCFLDVGSNIGTYALFATLIPSVTRIVAFEPNSDSACELRANIALNHLGDRIAVMEAAVSDASGSLTLGVVSKFSGANSVVDTSIHERAKFHKEVSVEAVTLDELVNREDGPLCLKIDVEGHEANVISGARAILSSNDAVVQFESYEDGEGRIARSLMDLGYFRVTAIGPDHYYSNMKVFLDPAMVIAVYERAVAQLVNYNHRNKALLLKRGDFAVQLTGRSATLVRELAKRVVGKHL